MFLLYIDSSGAPELAGDRSVFATLGVCVHEGTWYALESRLKGLKRRYACPGQPLFELHAKDFCTTIGDQSDIEGFDDLDRDSRRRAVVNRRSQKLKQLRGAAERSKRKKYRETEPFVHLNRSERSALLTDALDLLGSHDGIRLFAEVVDKQHLFDRTGQRDAMQHNFTQVVSRFDAFLRRYQELHRPSSPEKGILVVDKEPVYEQRCTELLEHFRDEGHPWGVVEHVIETPFFVDSATASAIQLADVACYALRRYVERRGDSGQHEHENFMRIYHLFDREGPRLHGLRHYCREGSCGCLACTDRRHGRRPNHGNDQPTGQLWQSGGES